MSYQPPSNGFRTFLIVWASQSLSVFGSALTHFAISIWLTQTLYPLPEQRPQLAFALSAIGLSFGLPVLVAGPIAGAWADRHDRRRTMLVVDIASGALSLVLAALMYVGALQLWMLIGLLVCFSVLHSFHFAAFDTSYAMLVPEPMLPRANGMMQTIWSLSGIVAPAAAAAIISLPALARQGTIAGPIGAALERLNDGAFLAIAIDAITFFAVGIVLLFVDIPSPKRTDLGGNVKKSVWADIREGGDYIWRRRPLLWLLGTFTVVNLVTSPIGVFTTLLVKFNLADDWASRGFTFETALALFGTFGSVGGFAGGLLISLWGGLKHRRVYAVVLANIVSGATMIVFGMTSLLYLAIGMAVLRAAMIPIMNAHSQAIWQAQTPRELQGRVFSVRRLIAQFTAPIGTAFAGVAGGLFDPAAVMVVLGSILVVFCVLMLFNPYLLRVEDREWLEEMATRSVANARA